jgi:hypothetical protein
VLPSKGYYTPLGVVTDDCNGGMLIRKGKPKKLGGNSAPAPLFVHHKSHKVTCN